MKQIVYLWIFAAFLGTQIFSYDFYGLFQLSLFRVLLVCVALLYVSILLFSDRSKNELEQNEDKYFVRFMVVWVLYATISLMWVYDRGEAYLSIYVLLIGILAMLIFRKTLKKNTEILAILRIVVLLTIFHNYIGWYEYVTGTTVFYEFEGTDYFKRIGDPISVFFNTNNFATFLMLSTIISHICMVNAKKWLTKSIYLLVMISSIGLIAVSESRANQIGLMIALLIYVYFKIPKRIGWKTLLTIVVMLLAIYVNMDFVVQSIDIIKNQDSEYLATTAKSDFVRLNLIQNGFFFLKETFGFGTGSGNVEYWMKFFGVYETYDVYNIHNWWMEILVGYGVVVFALYLIFYFKLFQNLYRIYQVSEVKVTKSISLGFMCIMAAYTVASISASSIFSLEWIWIIWAIIFGFQYINSPLLQIAKDKSKSNSTQIE